jgi:tetratricopeptide (TPR) repeat protein
MYPFKVIIKGRLEFGNQRSYDNMSAHYIKRLESYYKNDFILKAPEYFNEELFVIEVPRTTFNCAEKTWKNTQCLLRELKSYAVAGELYLWVFDEKNAMIASEVFKPQGDKVATTEYLRGIELMKKGDNEDLAIEAFSRAIEKYERYTQAFERRGRAYARLGRHEDALIDFSMSISLYPNAEALYGRANVKATMGDLEGAFIDFQAAIDNAIPHQPIFWMARRTKGEYHLQAKEYEKAIFELKFVTKRQFTENDPNFKYRKQAWQLYGEALMKLGQTSEAIKSFNEALSIENCSIVEDLLRSISDVGLQKSVKKPVTV